MLLLGGEQEMLEQLRGGEMPASSEVNILRDVGHYVDDLLVFTKLQTFLREVAELDRLADVELSLVGRNSSEKHLDESRLARAVVSHDAHLFKTGKVVIEILEDNLVAESL